MQVIIQQGNPGTTFYILFEGEVAVSIDGDEKVRLQASQERGTAQYFGERALLNNEPRAATAPRKLALQAAETDKKITIHDHEEFT